jgi:RES domain
VSSLPAAVPDLAGRELPLRRLAAGSPLYRVHRRELDPLWFGPAAGATATNRFDDPLWDEPPDVVPGPRFQVCYLGTSPASCFAETFLRNPPVRLLSLADLSRRGLARVRVTRALNLVRLHGPGLARIGVTAEATCGEYDLSRGLARALWCHPAQPDGIVYSSRHDNEALCIALFDRAREAAEVEKSVSLSGSWRLLGKLLDRYRVALMH